MSDEPEEIARGMVKSLPPVLVRTIIKLLGAAIDDDNPLGSDSGVDHAKVSARHPKHGEKQTEQRRKRKR